MTVDRGVNVKRRGGGFWPPRLGVTFLPGFHTWFCYFILAAAVVGYIVIGVVRQRAMSYVNNSCGKRR